ncbi:Heterochromatin protein 1 [Dissostichus eleginoides]|uniref:Heterochromatin protein 1 n=1 Tax=Dissostichus eleginoides TaxID=100907 RepID=A0AAD9BY71_DISEL|nr:Heterochromatin protein 1 [Dissostichus eleginoides]
MTRPKLRPCPTCQTLNKASIKTCTVCYGTLSTKTKFIKKAATLDGKWGQGVVRNRNVNRIIDSARIAVLKLEALGFKTILFYGHRDNKSLNKWVADVMTHFAASSVNKAILDKMRRVYEILLSKGCRKCNHQKVFLFEKIIGRRMNEGKAECEICWLPCSVCNRTWDNTWEPACNFECLTATPESPGPSGSA